jgi:hypothetical protein
MTPVSCTLSAELLDFFRYAETLKSLRNYADIIQTKLSQILNLLLSYKP